MENNITTEKSPEQIEIEELFNKYLDICNKALDRHKDKSPYKDILSSVHTIVDSNPIELAIYDDVPKGAFSIQCKDMKLVFNGTPRDIKKAWRFNLSYLKNVVERPDEYIENPDKLDMDWLKSRFGF
ncbi:MAG: hypothetical protein COV35_05905 [Alphaproteobacteria bacterium CG11_big_fil_rev_8_21_14_0_20_39_49]|nr:MAG: hypothetical protein COV35_05905 [Alphaproteobacteria bacterium CG11_big_fil_rev_8_21_14_0_20_39_49]